MKSLSSEIASSGVMGQIIMIGITITGISMLSILSLPSISGMENMITIQSVEQTFSDLSSQVNLAILGEQGTMIMDVNIGGGSLKVESGGESYITIKKGSDDDVIVIPMGKVTQRIEDKVISYEAGGTWSKEGSGGSRMLSSPNLDFNGAALTLPVISLNGNGSAQGKGTASVILKKDSTVILYPDADIPNRTNPMSGGEIYVNITSDFYDAWAQYAMEMGGTEVLTDPENHTASIKLSSGAASSGEIAFLSNPIYLESIDTANSDPIKDFRFRLVPYGKGFDWDIHAYSGNKRLIYHIKGDAKNPDDPIDIYAGYQDDGQGFRKPAETWAGHNRLRMKGTVDNLYLDVDLLDPALNLDYIGTTVGASTDKILQSSFNDSQFSWSNESQSQGTTVYKWTFDSSDESWSSNFTTNAGIVHTGLINDGMPQNSIYSRLTNYYKTATVTWTSPNFTWTNGTPASASLSFDWKVATYAMPGAFYVLLVKPDGSVSYIYPSTVFSSSANWSTRSNATVSANDFSQTGNYSMKLISILNTGGSGLSTEEVRWDNPAIILNSTGAGTSRSNKSLNEITRHYIKNMIQDGGLSFYQGYAPGEQPSSRSTILLDYNSTGAPIYLFVSQNNANVDIRQ